MDRKQTLEEFLDDVDAEIAFFYGSIVPWLQREGRLPPVLATDARGERARQEQGLEPSLFEQWLIVRTEARRGLDRREAIEWLKRQIEGETENVEQQIDRRVVAAGKD